MAIKNIIQKPHPEQVSETKETANPFDEAIDFVESSRWFRGWF